MELYLIRHADAAPVGQNGVLDDALRPLTPKGQEQSKAVGHGLVRRGVRVPMVVASPLLRARQTAEGIAQALAEPGLELRTCEELAPGGKRKRLRRFLKDLSLDAVALVGHEPNLGEFAAWLIGSKKARVDLAKAGVACIHFDGCVAKGEGRLLWLVTPEWF